MERIKQLQVVKLLMIAVLLLGVAFAEQPAQQEASRILIHITHGPEHPTRAALGFLVAKAAIEEGHTVTLFLAGDAVQLLRDGALDNLAGLGTGNLRESFDAVVASGATIHYSGMSASSRGLSEQELEGKPVQAATPNQLVQLSLEHDRMFTY